MIFFTVHSKIASLYCAKHVNGSIRYYSRDLLRPERGSTEQIIAVTYFTRYIGLNVYESLLFQVSSEEFSFAFDAVEYK